MNLFSEKMAEHKLELSRTGVNIVQVNLGKLCNQTCSHCHVDAGPHRLKENMNLDLVDKVIELLGQSKQVEVLDLTGGAPELNPHFRRLVLAARAMGLEVIDRCNLTVLFEPNQDDLPLFLANNKVRIVASLPCYTKETLESQRGDGVFDKSIKALQILNELGYGKKDSGLKLDLVYNPSGDFLPPEQKSLELDYKARLKQDFNIEFNDLFALTNLPVKRFAAYLKQQKRLEDYYQLLIHSFNPETVPKLMCTNTLSISWDGNLFDCDFNQMENLSVPSPMRTLNDLKSFDHYSEKKISTAKHCFGCTAGKGSSCQGRLAQ